jgi:hypothetical protein
MPDAAINLGKAYCKVELYDRLININYESFKLRQNTFFVLGTQPEQNFRTEAWGVQHLSCPGKDGPNAAAIIPIPCYEPVNNFLYTNQSNATIAASGAVYWSLLAQNQISALFKEIIDSTTTTTAGSSSTTPVGVFSYNPQTWKDRTFEVQMLKYRDAEFAATGFDYYGTYGAPATSSTTTGSAGAIPEIAVRNFVCQEESQAATWWGVTTYDEFFVPGGGFWVYIKPTPTYAPGAGDAAKNAFIAIKIAEFNKHHVLFIIDNRGRTMISYSWASLSGSTIDKNPDGTTTAPLSTKTRYIPVGLPQLSSALENGLPIRVGFFIACGRIFIYCGQNSYASVEINGQNPEQPPFIYPVNTGICGTLSASGTVTSFYEGKIDIYGYGCKVDINVCAMTFFQRAWFILKNMDGNIKYIGYKSPSKNTDLGGTTIAAGTYAPGYLMNWNIPRDQYINNQNKYMWMGQFQYYQEEDQISNPRTSYIINSSNAVANGAYYTPTNGATNWWGGIFIVRKQGVKNIWEGPPTTAANGTTTFAPIWCCYLETYNRSHTSSLTSTSITYKNAAFPIVYNIAGMVPQTAPPTYTSAELNAKNISDNIMSLEVSSALDNTKPSFVFKKASFTVYDDGDFDLYLTRARGVKIWLKWSTSGDPVFSDTEDLVFTGVAYGEQASLQPGRKTVKFTCTDYFSLVEKTRIKNSPFYDGCELFSVVQDLAERVGVTVEDTVDHSGPTTPAVATVTQTQGVPFYFLGSGYSFDQPAFKFSKNETLKECLSKTINAFPVYLWFSHEGKLQFSVVPGNFDFSCVNSAYFHKGWDYDIKNWYYRSIGNIRTNSPHKLILNEIQMTSTLKEGVYNSFLMMGVERTTNVPIIKTGNNAQSLNSPNTIGFLGYVSEIVSQQNALSSAAAVQTYLDMWMKMWISPGFETSITTIGHVPKYTTTVGSVTTTYQTRCGQFIQILQDVTPSNDRFRITEISHKYEAEKNEWYTTINAYQISAPGLTPSSTSSSGP